MSRQDLILLAFGGIQRYIAESHSTADLGNASRIVAELAKQSAEALSGQEGCTLVVPSQSALARAAVPDASSTPGSRTQWKRGSRNRTPWSLPPPTGSGPRRRGC